MNDISKRFFSIGRLLITIN